jgi:Tol biopolymer transport system component
VVFGGDLQTDGVFELYATPINGGARVNLSGTQLLNGSTGSFQISPDGSRVVFLGVPTGTVTELYSAPIGGGPRVNLSGSVVSGGNVASFLVSPDSTRVVFSGDLQTDGMTELYSVLIGGGTRATLSERWNPNGDASIFKISPDSARVVYWSDFSINSADELYSTPIVGGASVRLSGPVTVTPPLVASDFLISPDSARVVFFGDREDKFVYELYSTPIFGGTRVKISGTLVSGGDVYGFQMSPDGARVVFRADLQTDDVFELYRVQIGGAALALDIDGDDRVLPLTDLLLLTRYQLGMRGSELIANALGENATITGSTAIEARIRTALGVGLPF